MANVGGFAGGDNWLGAHAGEQVPSRGAATQWDLVHPWSSFPPGWVPKGWRWEVAIAASLSLALGFLVAS